MPLVWLLFCLQVPASWDPPVELVGTENETVLLEEAEVLRRHPLDVNRVTVDELLAIPWLSPLLACRIVAVRDSVGRFQSLDALRIVPGMTEEWYEAIVPFLSVSAKPDPAHRSEVTASLCARADSREPDLDYVATLGSVRIGCGRWQLTGVAEKDRGERAFTDWLGVCVDYRVPGLVLTAGSFTFGSALGLVFSGPHRRGSSFRAGGVRGPDRLRAVRTPVESRVLTGVGVEYATDQWAGGLFGSRAGRDARVNADGTVVRLLPGNVHDDSAAMASRDAVHEMAVGGSLSRVMPAGRLTANGAWVRYSRDFSPADSQSSFAGRELGVAGLGLALWKPWYRLETELAVSTGGATGAGFELSASHDRLSFGLGLTGYGVRYFAPLGRSPTLVRRRRRLFGRIRAAYRIGRVEVSLRGNTSCDFVNESLPGRVGADISHRFGRLDLRLSIARSYRLDASRNRSARLQASYRLAAFEFDLTLEDVYPDEGSGRGRMVSLSARAGRSGWSVVLNGSRFDISGSGTRMYARERTVVRAGSRFSTGGSAWRLTVAGGQASSGSGIETGVTWRDTVVFHVAMKVELRVR